MKKIKKEKAITLIALVITIVVLLILAGVSISMLTGENGILSKALKSKEETEIGSRKEEAYLKEYEDLINGDIIEVKKVEDSNPGVPEGEGTENNPFIINSIEDLVAFANNVRVGNSYEGNFVNLGLSLDFYYDNSYSNLDKKYKYDETYNGYVENENGQKNLKEILTTEDGWQTIGSEDEEEKSFSGTFNGNNYAIKNLYINRKIETSKSLGLFSRNKGIIKNLKVINSNINVETKDGIYGVVGNIAGLNKGELCNIVTSGIIKSDGDYNEIGGIVAANSEKIENCINKTELTGISKFVGGIASAATNNSKIINCKNMGTININTLSNYYVGGITGYFATVTEEAIIDKCLNEGKIELNINNKHGLSGGIVGYTYRGSTSKNINNCYNKGDLIIKGTSDELACSAGGIVGFLYQMNLYNSYNLGNIEIKGNIQTQSGGIVGTLFGGEIKNSYNEGNINATNSEIGGILGKIITTYPTNVNVANCFYLNNIEKGANVPEGNYNVETTKLEEKMNKDNLLNLLNQGSNTWKKDTTNINNGYPILNWQ